jgi:hypothetical protein
MTFQLERLKREGKIDIYTWYMLHTFAYILVTQGSRNMVSKNFKACLQWQSAAVNLALQKMTFALLDHFWAK